MMDSKQGMKCFGYGSEKCDEPGTQPDYETPAIFVNPEDRDGPTVRPVHCEAHHRRMMRERDENEASWLYRNVILMR